jgi:group I intron endonuclease
LNLFKRKEDKNCAKLYRALNKYSLKEWRKEILVSGFKSDASLIRAEIQYIKKFDSKNKGYNCTDGGEGLSGFRHSISTREKMRATAGVGKKNRMWGNKPSVKTRARISAALMGEKHSIERRRKIRESRLWKPKYPDDIIKFYKNFRSLRSIGRQFNASKITIRFFLERSGVSIRIRGGPEKLWRKRKKIRH